MRRNLSSASSARELKEIQAAFFQIITRPLLPNYRMKRDARSELLVRPSPKLQPHDRLELYAQQYWWRVLGSLEEDFPGVRLYLGAKRFERMLVRYLARNPSRSFTLRNLGRDLSSFLRRDSALPASVRTRASAIASVEWAQIEAFDAGSFPHLSAETLPLVLEHHTLRLQPSVQVLRSTFDVVTFLGKSREIRARRDASNGMRGAHARRVRDAVRKTLRPTPTTIAVYRAHGRVRLQQLSHEEELLLTALRRGGTLEQILKRVLSGAPRITPESIQRIFQQCTARQWVGINS